VTDAISAIDAEVLRANFAEIFQFINDLQQAEHFNLEAQLTFESTDWWFPLRSHSILSINFGTEDDRITSMTCIMRPGSSLTLQVEPRIDIMFPRIIVFLLDKVESEVPLTIELQEIYLRFIRDFLGLFSFDLIYKKGGMRNLVSKNKYRQRVLDSVIYKEVWERYANVE
jgi:hypothetical protein